MKPSRRQFLRSALAAPLAVSLARQGVLLAPGVGALGPRGQGQFENPQIIRYDRYCFTINGRDAFVVSAAFHYPRCPRALWRDRLAKLKAAGFNTIETCVFWNYHERQEGHADLSEFEEFVQLVKSMGFWMIAQPGPYISAEWERGGFPSWVAAKRIPLRSNHPESVKACQHWFAQVMPLITRYQVTNEGPIIMVQLEDDYDYWLLSEAEKREYIRALAQMAWTAGINAPLITCWTKQARDPKDADMARLMDTCDFFPRWHVLEEVPPALQKLRQEEPSSPLGVAELQGGSASQVGGKLSVEQEGVNGAQFNYLAKTAIEQGVTFFSIYMGFGGTNFDWAAKNVTTTYDYAALLREPGGLGEKYDVARGIGASLQKFGSVLTRALLWADAAQSTNPNVSVTERSNGASAVAFVRENANSEQRFKVTFRDPASPTHRTISTPREGELVLGPREMKMLPVQIPIPGSQLRYTTAEVLSDGLIIDRHYLIIYDEPGRVAEISLATENEPHVEGDALYQYWDPEYESVVIGLKIEKKEKILLVNNHLLVVALPRERALRTWAAEFPAKVVPGVEETNPMAVPFIGGAAQLAGSGSHGSHLWADLDFPPGDRELTVLLPPVPNKCHLDGVRADFKYDRPWRAASLQVRTPALPVQPIALSEVRMWVEKFDPSVGQWLSSPAQPLEELGPVPYGYVKYRAQFSSNGWPKMFLSTYADDAKKVFLNGKVVSEASNSNPQVEIDLSQYAQTGTNTLEIACELFGAPNFGAGLGELKGIEYARVGQDPKSATPIDSWQIQRFPAPMRGREIDPEFSAGPWQTTLLAGNASVSGRAGASSNISDLVPAFAWCRAEFVLESLPEIWWVPWKATIEADRDALIYLNGKFVGRYVTVGPQRDFYLPEPYLVIGGKRPNILTIVLAFADHAGHIRTLRIVPYEEFATRRTHVEFEW